MLLGGSGTFTHQGPEGGLLVTMGVPLKRMVEPQLLFLLVFEP